MISHNLKFFKQLLKTKVQFSVASVLHNNSQIGENYRKLHQLVSIFQIGDAYCTQYDHLMFKLLQIIAVQ